MFLKGIPVCPAVDRNVIRRLPSSITSHGNVKKLVTGGMLSVFFPASRNRIAAKCLMIKCTAILLYFIIARSCLLFPGRCFPGRKQNSRQPTGCQTQHHSQYQCRNLDFFHFYPPPSALLRKSITLPLFYGKEIFATMDETRYSPGSQRSSASHPRICSYHSTTFHFTSYEDSVTRSI